MKPYTKSEVTTKEFEQFMVNDAPVGLVHWLTQKNSSEKPMYSGIWICEPITFEYEFPGDEVFHVLHGNLQIEFHDGKKIDAQEGDIFSFSKGLKSTWTVKTNFKKFFVISNC